MKKREILKIEKVVAKDTSENPSPFRNVLKVKRPDGSIVMEMEIELEKVGFKKFNRNFY